MLIAQSKSKSPITLASTIGPPHYTTVNRQRRAAAFVQNMKDIKEHGLEGAMQKWHDDEAKERRKLGLTAKERY